jgi:hypothetical protein
MGARPPRELVDRSCVMGSCTRKPCTINGFRVDTYVLTPRRRRRPGILADLDHPGAGFTAKKAPDYEVWQRFAERWATSLPYLLAPSWGPKASRQGFASIGSRF